MRALVATGNAAAPLELRDVEEPTQEPNQVLVETRNVSINRGELRLLASRPSGWRPGQDVAGTVISVAKNGEGPPLGSRVVAMVDQAGWAERVAATGWSSCSATHLAKTARSALPALREGPTPGSTRSSSMSPASRPPSVPIWRCWRLKLAPDASSLRSASKQAGATRWPR